MAKLLRAISKFFASLSCLEDNSDEIRKHLSMPPMQHKSRASAYSAKPAAGRVSAHGPYSGTTRCSSSVYSQASGYSASVYSQASGWGNNRTLGAWNSSDSRPMPMEPWEKYRLELHGIIDGDFIDGSPVPLRKTSRNGYPVTQRQVSRCYSIPR
jgi:hypothetical protein